jgi:Flp pilus assembly protein TadB
MDRKEQHHQHRERERQEKIREKKEHEREMEKQGGGLPFHPAWFVAVGAALVIVAMLIWTFFIWT